MNQRQKEMQHVIYQIDYQKALKAQVQTVLDQLHNNNFETVSEYLTKSYEDGFIGTMYDLQGQGIPLVFPIDENRLLQQYSMKQNCPKAYIQGLEKIQRYFLSGLQVK